MTIPETIPPAVTQALPSLLASAGILGSFEVVKLTGDASNRSYFRAIAGNRTFVVMKLADGFNSVAEEITKVERRQTELPFIDVQKYLFGKGVAVPRLFGVDRERGILLLGDFGDRQLLDEVGPNPASPKTKALYSKALTELEKISRIDESGPKECVAFFRRFDRDLYNWEFLHFVEYGLDKTIPKPPKGADRESLVKELEKVTEEYLSWEPVFCHRDYHSRNLMIVGNPEKAKLGILDFQDALLAPLYYDLASLLRDSYIALPDKTQDELVEEYRRLIRSRGLKGTSSRDEFRRDFDLMGLHRNLKAAGRFCYIDQAKKNPHILQMFRGHSRM